MEINTVTESSVFLTGMDFLKHIPFQHFFDPNKRIYWPYILLSLTYAILFILFSKIKFKEFGLKYWFHPSAILDYIIWALNHILQVVVLPLLFINSLQFALLIFHQLESVFGKFNFGNMNPAWGVVFYSLSFFILSDFTRFLVHWVMHQNNYLWNFHKMHHTAEVLTPITFFRVHPLEMLVGHLRYLLVHGVVTGIFIYFYSDVFNFLTILGASFFVFLSNILGGNLRHSHIPLGFGIFERVFISPKQHQMHHSKQLDLQQSNYGSFFAIWDVVFSTWKPSKGIKAIEYGVSDQPKQSITNELIKPVLNLLFVDKIITGIKKLFLGKIVASSKENKEAFPTK